MGLNIYNTMTMRVNSGCNTEVTEYGTGLEDVDKFTYLGSLVNKQGIAKRGRHSWRYSRLGSLG